MRIWVTRTSPDAALTQRRLEELGHEVVAAPVLTVRAVEGDPRRLPAAVVFSSANGVRHHHAHEALLGLPVFTVGSRTAEVAREAGYRRIASADGDVADLKQLVLRSLPPSRLVHFSARDSAGNLAGFLGARGYQVERRIVYAAEPVPLRSLIDVRRSLPAIDGIMVHSPRAAARVARLLAGTGWAGSVWCISPACALELAGVPGIALHFARRPTEAAMIEMVQDRACRDRMRQVARPSPAVSSSRQPARPRHHPANDNAHHGALCEGPEHDPPPAA